MKTAEFEYIVDPDEVAHNEPHYLALLCLPSRLSILNVTELRNFADTNFPVCLLALYG